MGDKRGTSFLQRSVEKKKKEKTKRKSAKVNHELRVEIPRKIIIKIPPHQELLSEEARELLRWEATKKEEGLGKRMVRKE